MSQIPLPSLRLAQLVQTSLEPKLLSAAAQPSPLVLGRHVGAIVAWLVGELQGVDHDLAIDFSSAADAEQGLGLSLALERVVVEFHELRRCVFELAAAHKVDLTVETVDTVNRVIDTAIAAAVKSLAEHQSQRREESLATAVHDLRSPLAALSLAASLLERLVHPAPESQERALLDIMRSSVEKQDKLFYRVVAEAS